MAKKCSIVPQISFNGKMVDSKAFSTLLENAKLTYSGVKARNVAVKNYSELFTDEFAQKYGDWNLLRKLTNNLANEADLSNFSTNYDSNIEKLKDSITIELDSYGEPVIKENNQYQSKEKKLPYYTNDKSNYLSSEDQIIFNRVLSQIVISSLTKEGVENLANIKVSDLANNSTIKNAVVVELKKIASDIENKNFETVIEYIENDEKKVWEFFVGYFVNKFNIRIKDLSEFEDDSDFDNDSEVKVDITKRFDDSQLDIDIVKTTTTEVKFELAKSLYSGFKLFDEYEEHSFSEKGDMFINYVIRGSMVKYNINVPMDVDDIWNQILSINTSNRDKRSIIYHLQTLSTAKLYGALDNFIERLETDEKFFNIFSRTASLAVTENVSMIIDKDTEKESTVYVSMQVNNRKAKAENVAYDRLLNNITSRLKINNFNLATLMSNIREYKNGATTLHRYSSILNIARELGIPLNEYNIAYYASITNNVDYPVVGFKDYIKLAKIDENLDMVFNKFLDRLETITASVFKHNGINYSSVKKSKDQIVSKKSPKSFKPSTSVKGAIRNMAKAIAIDFADVTSMSYYNSKFDREQSPQYNSYLTDFFDGLDGSNTSIDFLSKKLNDFINDPRLDYDNFLWKVEDEGAEGIFTPSWNNGKNVIHEVNKKALETLKLIAFNGNRYSNSDSGQLYKEVKDDNWNLTEVFAMLNNYYMLPTSDSGRMFGVYRKFERFENMLNSDAISRVGLLNSDVVSTDYDFRSTRLYQYILNNIKQEFKDIQLTFDALYDREAYINELKVVVRDEYKDQKNLIPLIKDVEVVEEDGKLILVKNNKPVGSVFSKTNLVYNETKDGVKTVNTLSSTFESLGYDYLRRVLTTDLSQPIDEETSEIISMFVSKWLVNNQLDTIKALNPISDEIVNALHKRISLEDINDEKSDDDNSDVNKNSFVPVPKNKEGLSESDIKEWSFNITALNLFLNNHFNTVIFGNLLFGNITEFKNMVNWNKRVNHTIRNGASTKSEAKYNMVVCNDISLLTNMTELMKNVHNATPEDIAIFEERYKKEIVTTNAIDIITDVELERRLAAFGTDNRYAELINSIKNDPVIDFKKYGYLIEQLKYFSYTRKNVRGRVISIQNKNSTIVLFKNLVKGTERELLYDFMIKNDIHDINTSEGHKLGGFVPITLHTSDGKFNRDLLNMSFEDVSLYKHELDYKDLRIQLEVVPHLLNKQNRISTQLIKKSTDNLIPSNNYYMMVNGKRKAFKGSTGKYKDGEMGIYEMLQYALSQKAKSSAIELLNEFGALKNGQIQRNDDGSIKIDHSKIGDFVEKYFMENSTDYNIIKAVMRDEHGKPNLPYHHPTLLKLVEKVLEARITNSVTRQKIKGSHLAIQPDMFMEPIKAVKEATNQDTYVTYTRDFLKESSERESRKLRSDYYDKQGNYHPAEIVINPFDKRFYDERFLMDDGTGRIDINKINELDPKMLLVFGTRIPHEGDQSAFVAKIVGFIQNGASTAITPDHLIARTGWDFDIDTIYLYHYSYNKNFEVADIHDTSAVAENRRLNEYIKTYYPDKYNANASRIAYENHQLYLDFKKDLLRTESNVFGDTTYRHTIKNLEGRIERAKKTLEKAAAGLIIMTDAEIAEKNIKLNDDINEYYKIFINPSENNKFNTVYKNFKYVPGIQDIIKKRYVIIETFKKKIAENKLETAEYDKFKESVRKEFNKLDMMQKATKQELDNLIIDSFISLHTDQTNFLDREKPNEMDHVKSASDFVNKKLDYNTDTAHPTNLADKMFFRNLNMNVSTLKENSVAYDNVLALMSVLSARNSTNPVEGVMRFSEVKGYSEKDSINTIDMNFQKIFGKGNYSIDHTNKIVHIKNIGLLGNNASGTGLDIQGERIFAQRSELTTNILDAVKQLMVNINRDSFAAFAYLASTPLSYYTNIHTKDSGGNAEVNRFIYPALFISQPAIQDIIKLITVNNRFGEKTYSRYSIMEVTDQYLGKLITRLVKNHFNDNDIIGYLDDMSKHYMPSDDEINTLYETVSNFDLDEYIQEERAKFATAVTEINNFTTNGKISISNVEPINKYLTKIGSQTIKSRPYTLDVLSSQIDKGKTFNEHDVVENDGEIDYLVTQLSNIKYYETLDKAAGNVTSLMSILNTDKLGAGPSSSVTNKLFNNIVKYETNFGEFEAFLRAKYKNDYETFSRMIKEINDTLYSIVSLKDKISYVRNLYSQEDIKFKRGYAPITTKSGKTITDAVYGDMFRSENPDFLKSEYPYLASQAIWTNLLSTKIYNDVILSENPAVKSTINRILSELNSIADARLRYRIQMYLMNKDVANIPFFKDTDYTKILGITDAVQETVEHDGKTITKTVRALPTMINHTEVLANRSLFESSTLANQILMLDKIGHNTGFLKFLSLRIDTESLERNGYIEIATPELDSNLNEARSLFKKMYNSTNEFDRIVAENIIKYAFITKGLQFDSSISRYIPNDIFFDRNETGLRDNGLYNIKTVFENSKTSIENFTETDIDNIHKSNWDNDVINPLMEKTYYFKDGKRKVNTNRPTWDIKVSTNSKMTSDVESPYFNHIITELASRIEASKYADKEYLTKEYNVKNSTVKVLYKRFYSKLGDYYLYYPINKTLAYEYGNTSVEEYKRFPFTVGADEIQPEHYYHTLIMSINVSSENVTKTEAKKGSYTEVLKDTAASSDFVIHIGESDTFEAKAVNANFKNKIMISEDEFIKGLHLPTVTEFTIEKAELLANKRRGIPQNLVSGKTYLGHKQNASEQAIKATGKDAPTSLEMIKAGVRTRTTRSASEFAKYNISVGDFVWMEGTIDGKKEKVLTVITDIYTKKNSKFKENWHKEGWSESGFDSLSENAEYAIEFKQISSNKDINSNDSIFAKYKQGLFASIPAIVTITGDPVIKNSAVTTMNALVKFINSNNILKINTIISPDAVKEQFKINIPKIITRSNKMTVNTNSRTVQHAMSFTDVEYAESTPSNITISMMQDIKQSEESILTIAERLNDSLKNVSVDNRNVIQGIVNKTKGLIDSIDPIFPSMDAISEVIMTNKILFDFITEKIDAIHLELDAVDITKFGMSENYNEMVDFSKKLRLFHDYVLTAEHILSLPIYTEESIDKLSAEDTEIIYSYNNAVIALHKNLEYVNRLKEASNIYVNRYHSIQIISRSRNPEFVESIYSNVVNQLTSDGFTMDEMKSLKVSEEDIKSVINKMLNNNEDISWFAAKLDSARDTYITIPDIMGKVYAEVLYRTHSDSIVKAKKFKTLLSKVYKNTAKEFDSDREKWFSDNFLTETGDLITEYDSERFYDSLKAQRDLVNIHREARRNALARKDFAAAKSHSEEIKKAKNKIKKLSEKIELSRTSDEYKRHFRAWANMPETAKNNYAHNNRILFVEANDGLKIFKYIPNEEFQNERFKKLSKENKEFLLELRDFLSTLVKDVFPTMEIRDTFVPYAFKPTLKGEFKRLFGAARINPETFFINLHGEKEYYVDATMLHAPRVPNLINIPKPYAGESSTAFRNRALKEINAERGEETTFKNMEDVYSHNESVKKAAKLKAAEVRNLDISNLVHNLISELSNIKVVKDFESTYRLTLITLGSEEFKASVKTASGKDIVDKIKSTITGRYETVKKSGKNTNIYAREVAFAKALYDVSRVNDKTDVALNMVLRYTSLGTMGFNVRSGVKNVIIGYVNMMNEALSSEFVDRANLTKASAQYRKALTSTIRDAGKEESDNFTTAMMKHFAVIFEDTTETLANTSNTILAKSLKSWDNLAYLSLNSGEHFMQFTMLLAMLKSHKVVGTTNGIAMSLSDYINDRRLSILKDVLSTSHYNDLYNYINDEKAKNQNSTNYIDYINDWLNINYREIDSETKTKINEALKDSRKTITEEFNALPDVESQFELVDGVIQLKADAAINAKYVAEFADRVKKVNHSLHGIYNRIDRNSLQDSLIGELFIQFRKWMRPTFIRWFGAKYGKTQFSEGTGTYRAGAYLDFWKFISTPVTREGKLGKNVPIVEAVMNIAKGYIEFLQNLSYYYNKLPSHQRANVIRSLVSMFSMASSSILLWAAYGILGGGDDDEKLKTWWASAAIYQLSAIQTELFETTRFGWATFYLRSKRNIMASERALTDLASFFYYMFLYPFQTDEQRHYQRGIYSDRLKMEVKLSKSIPLVRQIQTEKHLTSTINYYQMYNPILNLVGNK